jgi:hypothetical protein
MNNLEIEGYLRISETAFEEYLKNHSSNLSIRELYRFHAGDIDHILSFVQQRISSGSGKAFTKERIFHVIECGILLTVHLSNSAGIQNYLVVPLKISRVLF